MPTLTAIQNNGLLDVLTITDTNPHTSKTTGKQPGILLLGVINNANQTASVQFQGSLDGKGTKWFNLGDPLSVAAGTNKLSYVIAPVDHVRAQVTYSVAPNGQPIEIYYGYDSSITA